MVFRSVRPLDRTSHPAERGRDRGLCRFDGPNGLAVQPGHRPASFRTSLAAQRLPKGIGHEWTDLAFEQKQAGDTALLLFGASVVFVFMVLAAQYESWAQPLSVILIVPMCLLAAVSGLRLRSMSVDILAQIGFVVLVALASKNAILIVEFAKQAQDAGATVRDAAVEAARTRLRPILMTSLAFILGVVPLAVATGAGAEMRQSLGTAVFFGMLGGRAIVPLYKRSE
jgi:multidrug efflux pump subunit AcrB